MAEPSNPSSFSERRQKERINVRGYCQLVSSEGSWHAHLVNVSNDGALIAVMDEHNLMMEEEITLKVDLAPGESTFFYGSIAHVKEHYVGIAFSPPSCSANAEKMKRLIQHVDKL